MHVLAVLLILWGCSHKVKIVAPGASQSREKHEGRAREYMVTTQGEATSQAAIEMFERGGNIIDAFVAASFAISVERPQSTGIGGGGFLLYFSKSENKVYAFDFREVAPLRAHSKMYLTKDGRTQTLLSQEGALAVATPGLVKGLWDLHRRWGRLAWKETLAPAIRLAHEGFPLYEHLHVALSDRKFVLLHDPDARRIFFTPEGEVPKLGSMIYQPDLGRTLEIIAKEGSDGFYQGPVARAILKTVHQKRGILSQKDLTTYRMKERSPVEGSYRGLKIFSMPPPSSGGIHVIQILKMLEAQDLRSHGPQSLESTHLTAMAMQRAFQDRALYLGDPDFHPVPVKSLLDEKYLKKLSQEIKRPKIQKAQNLRPVALPYESSETTHFTLADKDGNMVASTQTINGWFGSGVIAAGTGIVLNNEMDDFAQKVGALNLFGAVGGEKNLVQAKKRPLSSMSPTIITKKGQAYMGLGSPSGTRIINCVVQTILNKVEFGMPLYESVAATRIHQQWQPDELKIEAPYLAKSVEEDLKKRGHKIVHGNLGCSIQAIVREKKQWIGVSDPRGEGLALGR